MQVYWHICWLVELVDQGSYFSVTSQNICYINTFKYTERNGYRRREMESVTEVQMKNKVIYFPLLVKAITAVWMYHLDADKTAREEAGWQLHKNVASNIK